MDPTGVGERDDEKSTGKGARLMKIRYCLFLAAAAGLSGCATTDSPSTGAQAAPAAQTTDAATTEVVDSPARMTSATTTGSKSAYSGSDLVCKDIATIGTRFKQRICKTKAQIAEEKEASKSILDPSKTLMAPPPPRDPPASF